jgi:hypothetical protein
MAEKDVFDTKEATASVSESENPAIPAPTPKRTRPRTNKDWWPNQIDLSILRAPDPIRWARISSTRRSSRNLTSKR